MVLLTKKAVLEFMRTLPTRMVNGRFRFRFRFGFGFRFRFRFRL